LVIALYWKRRSAICENNTHHTLVEALRNNDGSTAEELMTGHLLDIYSQLDLREHEGKPVSLKDALRR
jgi:DNA-binding GntR family transcriptional regulator